MTLQLDEIQPGWTVVDATGEELGSKIGFLRQKGFSVVAPSSHAKETLVGAKVRRGVAGVVGDEGAGRGARVLELAGAVVGAIGSTPAVPATWNNRVPCSEASSTGGAFGSLFSAIRSADVIS